MNYLYTSSKAVKINNDMRNDLNVYNQRKNRISDYTKEIEDNLKLVNEKNKEIEDLQAIANSEDKREAKEASRKLKVLQREVEKLLSTNSTLESRRYSLSLKQNASKTDGIQMKDFPEKTENSIDIAQVTNEPIGEYKDDESFVPEETKPEFENTTRLSNDDIEAIWNGLHKYDDENVSEETESEPKEDIPEATEIENPEIEIPEVDETEKPVVTEEVAEEPITPIYDETTQFDPIYEEPKVIEPIVISEEPLEEPEEEENNTMDHEEVTNTLEKEIHEEVKNEFPEIEVPEPMNSEEKLSNIYKELEVEPKLPDNSKNRDLKNLTLFVDYNDYTFTFAQQHYNKDALKPEEIANLIMVRSYLNEKDFNTKRTTQYNKITAENKRLNKKIVSLSKEFTKTIDKLSKEYVNTTGELTNQTLKAKEQIEIDRVEKVQTQRLNDSLTNNIKEQANHIEELISENTGLKETIEAKEQNIKDLEKVVSEQADKIKVFEEKLNTVLGIVKEVKGEKKKMNKD